MQKLEAATNALSSASQENQTLQASVQNLTKSDQEWEEALRIKVRELESAKITDPNSGAKRRRLSDSVQDNPWKTLIAGQSSRISLLVPDPESNMKLEDAMAIVGPIFLSRAARKLFDVYEKSRDSAGWRCLRLICEIGFRLAKLVQEGSRCNCCKSDDVVCPLVRFKDNAVVLRLEDRWG